MDVDGNSAALHRWGTGKKTILFLHGWMSNSQRWQLYVERIDLEAYSVYALDAPGHGMAKGKKLNIEMYRKAVVETMLRTGEVETLVCHSLAGLVASYSYLVNQDVPIQKYVIMGAPSGMDAIFTYFERLLGLSKAAMTNLDREVHAILKIRHQNITMANFFSTVKSPLLVIHDTTDTITPFKPIKEALLKNTTIETLITSGLKHDLKSEEVYRSVVSFSTNKVGKIAQPYSA